MSDMCLSVVRDRSVWPDRVMTSEQCEVGLISADKPHGTNPTGVAYIWSICYITGGGGAIPATMLTLSTIAIYKSEVSEL